MSDETNIVTTDDIKGRFGFDPEAVGNRHRGWWIVEAPDEDDAMAGAQAGDLCIKSRDGASNPPDCRAGSFSNYVGTIEDSFDCTYRYYYYRPLDTGA